VMNSIAPAGANLISMFLTGDVIPG